MALTFVLIIAIPLLLTVLSFMAIRTVIGDSDDPIWSLQNYSVQDITMKADDIYNDLLRQKYKDSARLEDEAYLQEMSDIVPNKAVFLLGRKGNEIFFKGTDEVSDTLIAELPPYGRAADQALTGIWLNEEEVYIQQLDFYFQDGAEGSIFVIAKGSGVISRRLMIDMLMAIIVILVLTSVGLTAWINRGVYEPVQRLSEAMTAIRNGDYNYILDIDEEGEIGDLFRNYEDMRLRLKESAEEKVDQEARSRELISNISHDLKTPITSIKGYVEGIMDGVADTPEKMDRYIHTIYNKTVDMDRLINELTVYSKAANDRIPYKFLRINVSDYFGDCKEEVGLDLEARGIDFRYASFVPEDTMIIADPEQMKKVINNIIGNSVKYMDKPRGVIEMRLLDEVDSVRVEIEDNGKGIAQENLEKIFDRFYRTDAARNSNTGGSGIGLSIVKKIIEDHGGMIWATAREGEGTCMHFVLRKYVEL